MIPVKTVVHLILNVAYVQIQLALHAYQIGYIYEFLSSKISTMMRQIQSVKTAPRSLIVQNAKKILST